MAGVNKVIILGNLGQVPMVRHMPNGEAVANLSVATSETWKDKQTGQQKEKTEWHRVVMFGRLAEIASKHLVKGSKVYIEGTLQTRKWQNQQGQDQYTTEIIVQSFNGTLQMLNSPVQSGGQQADSYSWQGQQQGSYQQKPAQQQYTKAPQQQGGQAQQSQQQGGFQQQDVQPYNSPDRSSRLNQPKANPQESNINFDDGIPF